MSNKKLNTFEKLSAIQQEIKVAKSQYNSFGKYYYRSAEDILEALKPFEGKYNVTFMIDDDIDALEAADKDIVFIKATAIMIDNDAVDSDGYAVRVNANGHAIIDFEAKGMQMPQRTGAASSYAKKFALGNLLLLDDTKDPDDTNTHGKDVLKAPAKPATPPKPVAKAMSADEKTSFVKAIADGKFAQVEKYLSKYKDDATKKAVVTELNKAKSGK